MDYKGKSITDQIEGFINKNELFSVIIMMVVASIILAHSFFDAYPLHTTTDELGAIVGAATLAGYDWSGVIDKCAYYGFGYYALFAPLFKMHLSPIAIYRIILVFTRILRGCAISAISYYIGRHYFNFSSKLLLIQLSIICTLPLHPNDDANIINDVVLDMMLWIIILLVCKIAEYAENTKKCILMSIIYVLAVFYTSFLHTRALVIAISSFLTILGVFLYKKNKILLCAFSAIPVVVFANFLIGVYQRTIWTVAEGLRNASVNVTTALDIFDLNTWNIWLRMVVGNITVQSLLTGGLFFAIIVVFARYVFGLIMHKVSGESIYVNIVFAISILCVGAAFAAFMVSPWFEGMYVTWDTSVMGSAYSYKALCYVRYWNVFAMPLLLTGVYLLGKEEYQKCIRGILCFACTSIIAFVALVIPLVKLNTPAATFLYTYLTEKNEAITEAFFYKCILICMICMIISLAIYFSKISNAWTVIPIVLLMVIGYNNANAYYNEPIRERISSMALSSYEQKCLLEDSMVDIGQIYAFDDRDLDSNWYIYAVLQFYFYEYRIEDEYPTDINSNDIIITYGRSKKIEKDFPNLNCYMLDKNEVWYTNLELIGLVPEI